MANDINRLIDMIYERIEDAKAPALKPSMSIVDRDELLGLLDVLVDGRFVEALKDISLRFRGSSNQRLIDLNATRRGGQIRLLPDRR